MLKLCGFHISNYFNKARIAMLEKGLEFDLDSNCRPSQAADFLERTPMGKVPFLETDGGTITESQVICEYLEEAYPDKPLYPRDPFERARVRELITYIELHIELVARRLYPSVFFKQGPASEEAREQVKKGLGRGVRALQRRAKFSPYIAGSQFTLADCAAFVHLPLVGLTTKLAYGEDIFAGMPQLKPYLAMLAERPAFRRVNEDRKAAQAAMKT